MSASMCHKYRNKLGLLSVAVLASCMALNVWARPPQADCNKPDRRPAANAQAKRFGPFHVGLTATSTRTRAAHTPGSRCASTSLSKVAVSFDRSARNVGYTWTRSPGDHPGRHTLHLSPINSQRMTLALSGMHTPRSGARGPEAGFRVHNRLSAGTIDAEAFVRRSFTRMRVTNERNFDTRIRLWQRDGMQLSTAIGVNNTSVRSPGHVNRHARRSVGVSWKHRRFALHGNRVSYFASNRLRRRDYSGEFKLKLDDLNTFAKSLRLNGNTSQPRVGPIQYAFALNSELGLGRKESTLALTLRRQKSSFNGSAVRWQFKRNSTFSLDTGVGLTALADRDYFDLSLNAKYRF